MITGIVSNCWKTQLDKGESLLALVGEAQQRGFTHVELRQGCLGEFDESAWILANNSLASLKQSFPEIEFNLAVEFPFLSPEKNPYDSRVSEFIHAACMANDGATPHLRLVDLKTTDAQLESADISNAVESTVALTQTMISLNGSLSLEHALQSWKYFESLFLSARKSLGDSADRLQLCYDPCNLLAAGDNVDPVTITASLTASAISMVHFKQRKEGSISTILEPGDVDWPAVCETLKQINYTGPKYFEIAPSENIWDNLETSRDYLQSL
jgi:sugar phosphate isomerase/epimerase